MAECAVEAAAEADREREADLLFHELWKEEGILILEVPMNPVSSSEGRALLRDSCTGPVAAPLPRESSGAYAPQWTPKFFVWGA